MLGHAKLGSQGY